LPPSTLADPLNDPHQPRGEDMLWFCDP